MSFLPHIFRNLKDLKCYGNIRYVTGHSQVLSFTQRLSWPKSWIAIYIAEDTRLAINDWTPVSLFLSLKLAPVAIYIQGRVGRPLVDCVVLNNHHIW